MSVDHGPDALSVEPPHRLAPTGPVGSTDLCADRNAIDGVALGWAHATAGLRADELLAVELPVDSFAFELSIDGLARRLAVYVTVDDQPDDTSVDLRAVDVSVCHHTDAVLVAQFDALVRADELPVVRPDVMPVALPEPAAQPASDLLAQRRTVASTVCSAVSFPVVYALSGAVDTAEPRAVAGSFQLAIVVALDFTEPRAVALAVSGAVGRAVRGAIGRAHVAAVERALAGAHGLAIVRPVDDALAVPERFALEDALVGALARALRRAICHGRRLRR